MGVEIEERGASVAAVERDAVVREHGGALAAAVRDVRLLLIALWLGAAVFLSAAVAPSVFAVLRGASVPHANALAGSIVTRTLAVVNTGGFIIGLLLLASVPLFRGTARRGALYAEAISVALLAIVTGLGQWVIAAKMIALRASMGRPIDEVAQNDPLRTAFNSLHGYSVMALGIGIIAAAIALLLIARRSYHHRDPADTEKTWEKLR